MKVEFAKYCVTQLQSSALLPVRSADGCLAFHASEGNSFSFAAVDPLMEARRPIPPSLANGFASGPASVGGSNGKCKKLIALNLGPTVKGFCRQLVSVIVMIAGAGSAAIAEDKPDRTVASADTQRPLLTSLPGQAAVRVIALSEERSRVRFSASGLPSGLSINPQTGLISGVIDREASRNGGSPFVVKVAVTSGATASGISTINIMVENHPPVTVDDVLHLSPDPIRLNVLANDMDADGDRLIVTDAVATHGTVVFTHSGIVAYAPNSEDVRADTITYRVDDGHGGSAAGRVEILIK